jgi:hypothetical protein
MIDCAPTGHRAAVAIARSRGRVAETRSSDEAVSTIDAGDVSDSHTV